MDILKSLSKKQYLDIRLDQEKTVLNFVCQQRDDYALELVKVMAKELNYFTDVVNEEEEQGWTPVLWASSQCNLELV